ncbi:MAG: YcgL domain-containing protein [Oceanospirillales bacterium TMED91]|nr:YcgL domain-containing protein [Gammaproteobacteria bacterium]OUX68822.1 MAG: YcgL domain-containing protein [Oceanospirillales bacterium TMED91]
MRVIEVFKGHKKDEMYLYVDQRNGLKSVPEDLLTTFGQTEPVVVLLLTKDKKLARVTASDVLAAIEDQGYFLQMPPPPEALAEAQIAAMVEAEEKLADAQKQQPEL